MNLNRLMNELEVLFRCEARFGVPARLTAAALVTDYLYGTFDVTEPPIPVYPAYAWPEGITFAER